MLDGLNNAHNSMKLIFSQTSSIFLLKVKARQVCTGIGHRLPIIDSFPSLLGALHIGPILVAVALLTGQGGGGRGQIVAVSSPISTSLEAERDRGKIQRFLGDQTSKIWLTDLAGLAFRACHRRSKWQLGCHYTFLLASTSSQCFEINGPA